MKCQSLFYKIITIITYVLCGNFAHSMLKAYYVRTVQDMQQHMATHEQNKRSTKQDE